MNHNNYEIWSSQMDFHYRLARIPGSRLEVLLSKSYRKSNHVNCYGVRMKPYYEHAGITIYHGDCREIIPQLTAVDLLLTDPPYGLGMDVKMFKRNGKCDGGKKIRNTTFLNTNWDSAPPPRWLLEEMIEKAKYSIIWGGNYFNLPPARCFLVWDKDNGTTTFADCELAWTNLDKAVRKIKFRWNGMLQEDMKNKETRYHPTQKPLGVIKWAIGQAPEECQTILDPFMGSGTTLRAAKDLGRQAIGIELEEKYCEIAAIRLGQEVLNFDLATQQI